MITEGRVEQSKMNLRRYSFLFENASRTKWCTTGLLLESQREYDFFFTVSVTGHENMLSVFYLVSAGV